MCLTHRCDLAVHADRQALVQELSAYMLMSSSANLLVMTTRFTYRCDLPAVHTDRQVLGHVPRLDGVDDGLLHVFAERAQLLVVVQLGAVREAAGPREDARDGVGGRGLALLVLAPLTRASGALRCRAPPQTAE